MLRKQIPKFEIVTIYICMGKAYIPTQIRYETEQSMDGEPVYICDLVQDEFIEVFEKILRAQKVRLPRPKSMDEIYKSADSPILRATKKRNWIQLAKECTVYMIVWAQEEISISISQLDNRGRFEFPNSLKTTYSKNMTLADLAKIVLLDYKSRNTIE